MEKPIEVGCWAVIYRGALCCGWHSQVENVPFQVSSIEQSRRVKCPKCGAKGPKRFTAVFGVAGNPDRGSNMVYVKRIDPPGEEQTTDTKEELTV